MSDHGSFTAAELGREIARLRQRIRDDEAEMPVIWWGMYGAGGLVSWLHHPAGVAVVGGFVAGCYWLRNRRARKTEEAS